MSEPVFLTDTRAAYDSMAADYAERVRGALARLPLERALLGMFGELVRSTGNPLVADVGCGPGQVTELLAELGLDAYGLDLSPGMVELARRAYPKLRFEVGSMLALDVPAGSLGGLLAFYSVIHVPWELRAGVFAGFLRALAPGGFLMLAFQIGSDCRHRSEAFGRPISVDWYRQQPDEVAGLLVAAGFEVHSQAVRPGEPDVELTPQGFVIARRTR